ncbi:MAG: P-loop NTPase [Desulfuromonadales bacterium]|nr:P-loop NTPase [Desulfuromonadales bacterium]
MEFSADTDSQSNGPRVWAIGGGKGGVGKSVICTALAMNLARRGERCVVIDADLGGANLHTFLGMPNPRHSLSDLFRRKVDGLQDILLPTPYENLSLVSGTRAMLDMANLSYQQKMKMIRQIFDLPADHIFLDLGAGSSYNVLDFFIAANDGLLVVMPTPTSIENAYHFLRAVYFRKLRKVMKTLGVEELVNSSLNEKVRGGIRTPQDLMADLKQREPEVGQVIAREMEQFSPCLIVNQAQRNENHELAGEIAMACRDFFGIEVTVAGVVRADERVLISLNSRRPVLDMFPNSPFAEDVQRIVRKMTPDTETDNERRSTAAQL